MAVGALANNLPQVQLNVGKGFNVTYLYMFTFAMSVQFSVNSMFYLNDEINDYDND